ncbi:hypothetical protein ETB97_003367 [Aspergillus alliaceus]|uniref:Uncharacterized protein n=1 Tax=Petromyces alliaceus TaxID=209559 RepID=A0A8H6AD46_PETAA|nr:hypothetical protein ETB97_003367 [Aspergillus burnettii]
MAKMNLFGLLLFYMILLVAAGPSPSAHDTNSVSTLPTPDHDSQNIPDVTDENEYAEFEPESNRKAVPPGVEKDHPNVLTRRRKKLCHKIRCRNKGI